MVHMNIEDQKVIDLVQDDELHKLARRSDIRLGHELVAAGEVLFGTFLPQKIGAKVQVPGGNTRSVALEVVDGRLQWHCTCTADPKLFCKHLVAASVDAQREGRGDIYKAAGIILQDGKMLVERSVGKPAFIAPGGRLQPSETGKTALVRELEEEFGIKVDESDLEEFGTFSAAAANHPSQQVHIQVFLVKKWQGKVTPSAEVEEIMWINSDLPKDVQIGSIFGHKVVPRLKEQGKIS